MSYPALLVDVNGAQIPQRWNTSLNSGSGGWEPYTGTEVNFQKLDSITGTTINGATTYRARYSAKLSRNAKARTFLFYNNLSQNATTIFLNFFDSTMATVPTLGNVANQAGNFGTLNAGQAVAVTSEYGSAGNAPGDLAAHLDSVDLVLQFGAAPTTSGSFDLYVSEVF